jgi:hypothetical protein
MKNVFIACAFAAFFAGCQTEEKPSHLDGKTNVPIILTNIAPALIEAEMVYIYGGGISDRFLNALKKDNTYSPLEVVIVKGVRVPLQTCVGKWTKTKYVIGGDSDVGVEMTKLIQESQPWKRPPSTLLPESDHLVFMGRLRTQGWTNQMIYGDAYFDAFLKSTRKIIGKSNPH